MVRNRLEKIGIARSGFDAGFIGDRKAVTSIEYAIIASLMVIAVVISVPGIAPSIKQIFTNIAQGL